MVKKKKSGALVNLVNHALPAPKDGSQTPDIGWPRATAAPPLWSASSLEQATHAQESMRAALLLAISQKKRGVWQGEQGVQPDSIRRRSEAHPGPDFGHALFTLWLCDRADSEMRGSRICGRLKS